jgi:hypothetical protein
MKLVLSASALLLLAGPNVFTECGKSHPTNPPPPPPSIITPDPDALPTCPQDPPRDCWAICLDVDLPGFSDPCHEPPVGMLTAEFEAVVKQKWADAMAAGFEVCAQGTLFTSNVTPCNVGIVPVVDMSEPCKPAPPGCAMHFVPPQGAPK